MDGPRDRFRMICLAGIGVLALSLSQARAQETVIDGTSVETYERSVKAMADSLDEQDRKIFGQGLLNMMLTEYPAARGAEGFQLLQFMQPAVEAAHITLDGRTLEEILERGRSIAKGNSSPNANPADAGNLAEDSTEAVRQCLQDKVTIGSPKIVEGAYVGYDIEMEVTNGLGWAIAGIRIGYKVFSAGRSVAWLDENFSLSIPGGIEPGETRTISTDAFLPANTPDQLTVYAQVLDVSDQFERQLIRDVNVIGWGESKSEMKCVSR